jgi:hypothetical protein
MLAVIPQPFGCGRGANKNNKFAKSGKMEVDFVLHFGIVDFGIFHRSSNIAI